MKKILNIIIPVILFLFTLTVTVYASNFKWFDTVYKFNYAYVKIPNGSVIQGKCQDWRDFSDSDQLQVTIDNVTYLSAAENIVLVYIHE